MLSSVERRTNINIFLSACKDKTMQVKTLFKNAGSIEKMGTKDWEELLKTLQSFSKKMEANSQKKGQRVPGFILTEKAIKSLIDQSNRETNSHGNYELYASPYQQSSNAKELYSRYNMVSYLNDLTLITPGGKKASPLSKYQKK